MPPPTVASVVTPPPTTPSRETLPGVPGGHATERQGERKGSAHRDRRGRRGRARRRWHRRRVRWRWLRQPSTDDGHWRRQVVARRSPLSPTPSRAPSGSCPKATSCFPTSARSSTSRAKGSAFIIDPSGIAVTNNHIVAGAATLQVFVGGDTEPKNARVVGRSECDDLAVIDIAGRRLSVLRVVARRHCRGRCGPLRGLRGGRHRLRADRRHGHECGLARHDMVGDRRRRQPRRRHAARRVRWPAARRQRPSRRRELRGECVERRPLRDRVDVARKTSPTICSRVTSTRWASTASPCPSPTRTRSASGWRRSRPRRQPNGRTSLPET